MSPRPHRSTRRLRRPRPLPATAAVLACLALASLPAPFARAQPAIPATKAATSDRPAPPTEIVITAQPPRPASGRQGSSRVVGGPAAGASPAPSGLLDPAEAAGLRRPGWSLDLRRWMTLSRIYTAAGLPPPLLGEGRGRGSGWRSGPALARASGDAGGAPTQGRPPEGIQSLLVLGTDRRAQERIWRTDTLLWVFFHAQSGRIVLLSVPRDLWVGIPGHGAGRINTVDYLGEAAGLPPGELLRRTLEENLGLAPDHQLRLDLEGFVRLIDALGGVDVAVDCPLEDFFFDPEGLGGEVAVSLEPGLRHMDGQLALRYARSRWGSSDFERARRQQRLLRGLMAKARSLGTLRRIPQLWKALSPYLRSDLATADIGGLAVDLAARRRQLSLRSHVLQFPDLDDWTAPDGSQVLLLRAGAMPPLLARLLAEPPLTGEGEEGQEARSSQTARPPVALRDATGRAGFGALLSARLADAGWPERDLKTLAPQEATRIYHQPTGSAAAASLAQDLGLSPDALLPAAAWTGPKPAADLWLLAGADWQPCPHR